LCMCGLLLRCGATGAGNTTSEKSVGGCFPDSRLSWCCRSSSACCLWSERYSGSRENRLGPSNCRSGDCCPQRRSAVQERKIVTVHFIGAGPGAADLITVRGLRLIEQCPVCIYAGSLVPKELVAGVPKGAHL